MGLLPQNLIPGPFPMLHEMCQSAALPGLYCDSAVPQEHLLHAF
jgi:hypothetical protein